MCREGTFGRVGRVMADLRESSCYEGTPLPYQQGSQTASLVN